MCAYGGCVLFLVVVGVCWGRGDCRKVEEEDELQMSVVSRINLFPPPTPALYTHDPTLTSFDRAHTRSR